VVLAQLEALGVLEAVSLMTLGYPTRIPYAAVHEQYAAKLPAWAASLPPRELVEAIALAAMVEPENLAYGATTLFCRAGKAAFLEQLIGGDSLDEAMLAALQELLALYERKKAVMPIVQKNLRMWVHRRRFKAVRQAKRAEAALAARSRLRALMGAAMGARRLMADKVGDGNDAKARKRLQAAFRSAALASATAGAWAGAVQVGKEAGAVARGQSGKFAGAVLHAGHLNLTWSANGAPPKSAPVGECYCVLLSSRTLLCFELSAGSFDPATGEATGVLPIALDENAEAMSSSGPLFAGREADTDTAAAGAAAASAAATAPQLPTSFRISCGDGSWLMRPALYEEGDSPAVARATRTWVSRLSDALAAQKARQRGALARVTNLEAWWQGDEEEEEEEGGDDEATGGASGAKPSPHLAGAWVNGCFYRGDYSIAFYDGVCPDDPYA
jgi:hypothetical protein